MADIKQAFLNVAIKAQRLPSISDNTIQGREIIVYRFLRVVFGVKYSPFLLQGTIRHHCDVVCARKKVVIEFVERFLRDMYVDDCFQGVHSIEDGVNYYENSKYLMESAGFKLRKWRTNSDALQNLINSKEGVAVSPEPSINTDTCAWTTPVF